MSLAASPGMKAMIRRYGKKFDGTVISTQITRSYHMRIYPPRHASLSEEKYETWKTKNDETRGKSLSTHYGMVDVQILLKI